MEMFEIKDVAKKKKKKKKKKNQNHYIFPSQQQTSFSGSILTAQWAKLPKQAEQVSSAGDLLRLMVVMHARTSNWSISTSKVHR